MAGIPQIGSYPLPTAEELPVREVSWLIDPARAVLLVHDMQRFFVRALPPNLGCQVIQNTVEVRERCHAVDIPIAYSMQPGSMTATQRGLLADFWGAGMRADPDDREVIEELRPGRNDARFHKWRYSAFFHTDLLAWMRHLNRDQILICGIYAHVGILATALDAFTNDIQTFVVGDAIADFTSQKHRLTLSYLSHCCAVVLASKEVEEALS